jgi:hypothetical protein
MATNRNEADTRRVARDHDSQLLLARSTIAGLLAEAYRRYVAAQCTEAEQVDQGNQRLANSQLSSVHEVVL